MISTSMKHYRASIISKRNVEKEYGNCCITNATDLTDHSHKLAGARERMISVKYCTWSYVLLDTLLRSFSVLELVIRSC